MCSAYLKYMTYFYFIFNKISLNHSKYHISQIYEKKIYQIVVSINYFFIIIHPL